MSRTMTALTLALAMCGATAAFAADSAKKEAVKPAPTKMASATATHKGKKAHHAAKKKAGTSAKAGKAAPTPPTAAVKPTK